MADRSSDPDVEGRLRDFLAVELRRAEIDFPLVRQRPTPRARRAGTFGILAATVTILVLVVVGFGSRSSDGQAVGGASTSASPSPPDLTSPIVSATPADAASPTDAASQSEAASPTDPSDAASPSVSASASAATSKPSIEPARPGDGLVDCNGIAGTSCAKAIALARVGHKAEVRGASRIVVMDTCPPTSVCDRHYPFDVAVVFVTAGADTTGWYVFHVFGSGQIPTTAEPWIGEWPDHVVKRLRELPTAP